MFAYILCKQDHIKFVHCMDLYGRLTGRESEMRSSGRPSLNGFRPFRTGSTGALQRRASAPEADDANADLAGCVPVPGLTQKPRSKRAAEPAL
jgi:hypothetical protein